MNKKILLVGLSVFILASCGNGNKEDNKVSEESSSEVVKKPESIKEESKQDEASKEESKPEESQKDEEQGQEVSYYLSSEVLDNGHIKLIADSDLFDAGYKVVHTLEVDKNKNFVKVEFDYLDTEGNTIFYDEFVKDFNERNNADVLQEIKDMNAYFLKHKTIAGYEKKDIYGYGSLYGDYDITSVILAEGVNEIVE